MKRTLPYIRRAAALALLLALAACSSTPTIVPAPQPAIKLPPPPTQNLTGLERVMGQDANTVIRVLGTPVQDLFEAKARRLQFAGDDCVLDAYLYATEGEGEQRITYIEARNRAGQTVDRKACVDELIARNR
jgi:hypothetical protein